MKDTVEVVPAERAIEQEGFANRKLIRPSLSRPDHNHSNHNNHGNPGGERRERSERSDRQERGANGGGKKATPPEQTNAENFYYQKQMQTKCPMVVVLRDGEVIHGIIEWYDKACIKVNRMGAPNVMIYKPAIKYLYKEGENSK
jgi:sRNA-binding regulator protein Hfq